MLLIQTVLASPRALGQQNQVTTPPPHVQFSDWKEVPAEEDTSEFTASFPSAVTSPYPQNNVVPLRILLPADRQGPLPAVIILHYWGATDLRMEREFARELNSHEIGAVIMTLPYHLARTPPGFRSGQLAIQPDPRELVQTMIQSVSDVRRTIDFVDQRPEFDHSKLGIAGTSLGSLISILSYAVDNRITAASFILGGVDFANILWHSSRTVEIRRDLRRKGYTEGRLRTQLAPIEPENYLPLRKNGAVFVIGGKYDSVIPPADTRKLVGLIPGADSLWLDTGHYEGIFVEKRILRTVSEFFAKQFQGQQYTPPLRIYAPTLRVGVLANTEDGLQIGAGVDIFHVGPKNSFFSTVIATPKGLDLFAGFSLGHGFAAGGFASRRQASVGIWWSTVL